MAQLVACLLPMLWPAVVKGVGVWPLTLLQTRKGGGSKTGMEAQAGSAEEEATAELHKPPLLDGSAEEEEDPGAARQPRWIGPG